MSNLKDSLETAITPLFSVTKSRGVLDAIKKRGVPVSGEGRKQVEQVCALVSAGKLAECFVLSAAEAVRQNEPNDPLLYFFGVLRKETAEKKINLDDLLRLELRKLEELEPVDNSPIRPKLVRLADVEPQEVAWLWPERIALGKLTLIAGDPGLGKSFLTIDLAARVTTGTKWPDGSGYAPQGGVVLLNCEDDLGDTVRPRLDAAGADVGKVVAIAGVQSRDEKGEYERSFDLNRDMPALELAIDSVPDCKLVVIDPISGFCGNTDSHRNTEVRGMLAPLFELAARRGVAVVVVTHLRKGEGAAIYRSMGSLAFVAAARAAFVVIRDPEDEKRRLFLPVKNNIGNDTSGMAFTLTARHFGGKMPCLVWSAEPVTVNADDAMTTERKKPGPKAEAADEAVDFLRNALVAGPRQAKEVQEEAKEAHSITKRTLDRAKKALGVVSFQEAKPGPWWWRLPEKHVAKADCQTSHDKELGDLGNLEDFPNETDDFDPPESHIAKLSEIGNLGADDLNRIADEATATDGGGRW